MYTEFVRRNEIVSISTENKSIPLDPANSDYQKVLDDIIEQGADCFTGDIPTDLQTAADTKQFIQQIAAYKTATSRLAQYIIADGRVELTEMQATGEQVFNEDTMEMDDVMALVITQPAIEPVEPTVSTATNPLIVTDVAEREAAQAVVDTASAEVRAA